MSFKFSRRSRAKLDTCDTALIAVAKGTLALNIMDITVVEGHRDQLKQTQYYNDGASKVQWPNGKHNQLPSEAMDLAPYIDGSISWNKLHCCVLAGMVLAVAAGLGVRLRWGGNWDMDTEPVTDQDFQDLVHFELVAR